MKTREILTIIGLSCLGLCLLLCLLKMSMKDKKGQANCDKVCGMLFFAAAVLIGVSQLLKETSESYGDGVHCHAGAIPCPTDPKNKCVSKIRGAIPGEGGSSCPLDTTNMGAYNGCYTPDSIGCASSGGGASPGGGSCSPPPGEFGGTDTNGPLVAYAEGTNQCAIAAQEAVKVGYKVNDPNANQGKGGPCTYTQTPPQQFPKQRGCQDVGMNVNTTAGGVGKCGSCRVYKQ